MYSTGAEASFLGFAKNQLISCMNTLCWWLAPFLPVWLPFAAGAPVSTEERDKVGVEHRVGPVHSWLEPFLSTVLPGNAEPRSGHPTGARMARTTDPLQYGLSPLLAPSRAITEWLGTDASGDATASIPEPFQAMMGGPPGIMMGVPPGEPRDGSQTMPASLIAQMAEPLLPPRLGVNAPT